MKQFIFSLLFSSLQKLARNLARLAVSAAPSARCNKRELPVELCVPEKVNKQPAVINEACGLLLVWA